MKLILVRHGETNYNVKNVLSAKPGEHVFLTKKGTSQASEAAKNLKNKKFDIIFVSEMFRTQQTASIINQFHNQIFIVESNINEYFTDNEGKTLEEAHQQDKDIKDWYTYRHKTGESLFDLAARVKIFLEELKTKPFEQVLIVSHE